MLADHLGIEPQAHLHIHKAIPVAAGMAGGSADAAGALLALDRLWDARLERDELVELAAGVGSDVPFALVGHTAMGLGRGEKLTPVLARGHFHWVLRVRRGGLADPGRLRRARPAAGRVGAAGAPGLRRADERTAGGRRRRAGRGPAQRPAAGCGVAAPRLAMTLDVGDEYGALGALVSGSGPTCAFLARDEEHALDLAVALTASGTCRTVTSGGRPGRRRPGGGRVSTTTVGLAGVGSAGPAAAVRDAASAW